MFLISARIQFREMLLQIKIFTGSSLYKQPRTVADRRERQKQREIQLMVTWYLNLETTHLHSGIALTGYLLVGSASQDRLFISHVLCFLVRVCYFCTSLHMILSLRRMRKRKIIRCGLRSCNLKGEDTVR